MVAVAPAVAGMVWLAVFAAETGVAGSKVFESGVTLRSWSSPRLPQPTTDAVVRLRDDLADVASVTPGNPALHELLGLVDARVGDRQELLSDAVVHFRKAIELRPTSPQSWADLAAVKYRLGDTGQDFEAAIRRAAALGKFEPDVQATVASYGLAVWNEVGSATRASVEGTIAAAMKRNPLEMLQIAGRRGRLDVVCRHLAGSTRQVDPKWSHLCQSMEATS